MVSANVIGSYAATEYDNQHYYIPSCQGDSYILIENLFVPKEHRRKGFGRGLLREAIANSLKKELEIYIEACPFQGEDIPLQVLEKFYESEGFRYDSQTEKGSLMKFYTE